MAPIAVIPRFARWSNRRDDSWGRERVRLRHRRRILRRRHRAQVDRSTSSSGILRCASAGRRVHRSCCRSVRDASTCSLTCCTSTPFQCTAPVPAMTTLFSLPSPIVKNAHLTRFKAAEWRSLCRSRRCSSGRLIQRLTSEHRRCWLHHRLRPWKLFQDPAEYVQDQARPPTTVMTSLRPWGVANRGRPEASGDLPQRRSTGRLLPLPRRP